MIRLIKTTGAPGKDALTSLGIPPHQVLIISGIGQAAKTPRFLKCNMFHALYGRALPLATGAKMANHDLKIIVNSDDGDATVKVATISCMPYVAMWT